jgi:chromosome segregation ATPase
MRVGGDAKPTTAPSAEDDAEAEEQVEVPVLEKQVRELSQELAMVRADLAEARARAVQAETDLGKARDEVGKLEMDLEAALQSVRLARARIEELEPLAQVSQKEQVGAAVGQLAG